jgi:hypothetical protein
VRRKISSGSIKFKSMAVYKETGGILGVQVADSWTGKVTVVHKVKDSEWNRVKGRIMKSLKKNNKLLTRLIN